MSVRRMGQDVMQVGEQKREMRSWDVVRQAIRLVSARYGEATHVEDNHIARLQLSAEQVAGGIGRIGNYTLGSHRLGDLGQLFLRSARRGRSLTGQLK